MTAPAGGAAPGRAPPLLALRLLADPRLLTLVVLVVAVAGAAAFGALTRQEDPRLRVRFARILTPVRGATADRVEALVTEPLEEALREVSEIKKVESISADGLSVLGVQLKDSVVAVDTVWSKVRSKLQDAQAALPAAAGRPNFDDKRAAAAFGLVVGVTWEGAGPAPLAVQRRVARDLQTRLRNVAGTEYVRLYGAPEEELVVTARPRDLAALGYEPLDLAAALAAADSKAPAGTFRSPGGRARLDVLGDFDLPARLAAVPLRPDAAGGVRRLGDVARVRRGRRRPDRELAWVGGRPAVVVASRLVDGGRIEGWAAASRAVVAGAAADLPAGFALRVVFDQSAYTAARLGGLGTSLGLGAAIVFFVCAVMMGLRAAALVCAALPLTLSAVLFGLFVLGFPLHQMTIMGLIVALGLLIDNAIVVVEEIGAHRARGAPAADAVRGAVGHLWAPLAGSTLTTVLAFMPIVLLEGNIGEFIGGIGVSVVLSLLASFGVSTVVVAALAGRVGVAAGGVAPGPLAAPYRAFLRVILRAPVLGVGLGLAFPLAGFLLFPSLPQLFFPPADRDQFVIQAWLPPETEIDRTAALVARLSARVRAAPGVLEDAWFAGTTGPAVYYNVLMNVDDEPGYAQAVVRAAGYDAAQRLVRDLQPALAEAFPEALVVVRSLGQGPPIDSPLEVRFLGPDPAELRRLGEAARAVMHRVEGVVASRATLVAGSPKVAFRFDEARALQLGFRPGQLARILAARVDGARGGTVLEDLEELPVRVRWDPADRRDVAALVSAPLAPPGGGRVPLDALAAARLVPSLQAIPRLDGRRVNTVRGYLAAGELPKVVLGRFLKRWAAEGPGLPPGYRLELGGDEEAQGDAIANLLASAGVLAALMASLLILAFRSYRIAAVLASVAVFSAGLAALVIKLLGYPWGFMASIGTAGLIGLALNDSIVVVAALAADPAARAGDAAAMVRVVEGATRHILTTSLTTVGGFAPLLLGTGDFWPPLAAVVGLGVLGATGLALVYVPACVRILGFPAPCEGGEGAPDDLPFGRAH